MTFYQFSTHILRRHARCSISPCIRSHKRRDRCDARRSQVRFQQSILGLKSEISPKKFRNRPIEREETSREAILVCKAIRVNATNVCICDDNDAVNFYQYYLYCHQLSSYYLFFKYRYHARCGLSMPLHQELTNINVEVSKLGCY